MFFVYIIHAKNKYHYNRGTLRSLLSLLYTKSYYMIIIIHNFPYFSLGSDIIIHIIHTKKRQRIPPGALGEALRRSCFTAAYALRCTAGRLAKLSGHRPPPEARTARRVAGCVSGHRKREGGGTEKMWEKWWKTWEK